MKMGCDFLPLLRGKNLINSDVMQSKVISNFDISNPESEPDRSKQPSSSVARIMKTSKIYLANRH